MIKVFNFRKSFKYICLFIIILIICLFLLNNNSVSLSQNTQINAVFFSCLDETIPSKPSNDINSTSKFSSKNILGAILHYELPLIDSYSQDSSFNSIDNSSNSLSINDNSTDSDENNISYASNDVTTEIIANNVPNTYTDNYNGIEIKNSTKYSLSDDLLNPADLSINKNNIIIFHTHTCESYTPSDLYQYESSGNFRTTSLDRSVVKVGNELTKYLISYNYNVIHDSTYHDYPSYNGSYGRSMATVENLLSTNPGTDVIIDLHRDAIADTSYAPSVKIGNDIVSQLMFVIGSDGRWS